MTRGRRGSLALRRRALPSPPPCRFIPALSHHPRDHHPRPGRHHHLRARRDHRHPRTTPVPARRPCPGTAHRRDQRHPARHAPPPPRRDPRPPRPPRAPARRPCPETAHRRDQPPPARHARRHPPHH